MLADHQFIASIEHTGQVKLATAASPATVDSVDDEVVGSDAVPVLRRRCRQDPSLSHRQPRFGCFCGIFTPSRSIGVICTGLKDLLPVAVLLDSS
jgi:hypothetical protein